MISDTLDDTKNFNDDKEMQKGKKRQKQPLMGRIRPKKKNEEISQYIEEHDTTHF